MIKSKKCKGNGVTTGYGCSALVPVSLYNKPNRKYGLGLSCGCYSNWLLNSENGKIVLQKATLKVSKPRLEFEKMKYEKENRNSLSKEIHKTQLMFNKFIRERDKYKPCISSGIPYLIDFDAGHCFSVGSYPSLRFDYDNVHAQSINANRFLYGDFENYIVNLPERIGKKRTEELIQRAEESKRTFKKFTIEELKKIQKEIRNKMLSLH